MRRGQILQIGTAEQIYRRPVSRAVAAFVGETNLLPGKVVERSARALSADSVAGTLPSTTEFPFAPGDDVLISIRPECFRFVNEGAGNLASEGDGTLVLAGGYVIPFSSIGRS